MININKLVSLIFIQFGDFGLESHYRWEKLNRTWYFVDVLYRTGIQVRYDYIISQIKSLRIYPFAPGQWIRSNYKSRWMGKFIYTYDNPSWIYYSGDECKTASVRVIYDRRGNLMRKPELKYVEVKYLEAVEDPDEYILNRV